MPLQTDEEQAIALDLSNFIVNDPDNIYPTEFSLSVSESTNYTVSGTTLTPTPDFNGILNVFVTINDGVNSSESFNTQITINAVNDPPVITGHTPLQTNEDQPIILDLSNFIVNDPDNTYPTGFSLSVSESTNYTVSGTTLTPTPDFNGILNVFVTINDGVNSSESFNTQIMINAVNDPPVITGHTPLQTNEDQPIILDLSQLIVSDPDNSYPTGFTLNIATGDQYAVSGTTIIPLQNFSGTLSIPVQVNDGVSSSAPYSIQLQVIPVNDPPVIIRQASININEDQPVTIQFLHLTVSDPDNTYPTGFTITLLAGANYSVAGNTILPASGFSGTLTAGVTVSDGTSSSEVFTLQ